jgi:hypothetical protein
MPAAQHIDCDRQFVFGEQRCKRTTNTSASTETPAA